MTNLLWTVVRFGSRPEERVGALPSASDSIGKATRDDGLVFIPAEYGPGLWGWWCPVHKRMIGECRCGSRE